MLVARQDGVPRVAQGQALEHQMVGALHVEQVRLVPRAFQDGLAVDAAAPDDGLAGFARFGENPRVRRPVGAGVQKQNIARPRGVVSLHRPVVGGLPARAGEALGVDVQLASARKGLGLAARGHGDDPGGRRAAVGVPHHEAHLVRGGGFQKQHAAGEQVAAGVGPVILVGHLAEDPQQRQRLLPLPHAFPAIGHRDGGVAVVVSVDVPAEPQVFERGGIDHEPAGHDPVLREGCRAA